jgi:tRNA A-37 threonylcarbamoyl transferase component Bud32/tetratricopeptide (TPR) repeat protein/TolB-like protein
MSDSLARLNAALSGRYRVDREIGAGGMATVYLAEDLKHHRQVAVKVLRPDLAANLGAERFLREIEIAAKLQHPHILPLYDSGGAGDVLYYVMPLVEGQSLREKIAKSGALPIEEGIRVIRDVAGALAYSHQHGVVHRDIKPENVLLSSGHALVTDFGVAKAVSDAASTSELTGTGVTLGTPAYMAPEQATADASLDHRADIYALGVMSYEMLAGHPPFAGNPQQIIVAHVTRQPEALSAHRPAVPPELESVVMRCLQKNPADRFQDAGEILRALDAMGSTSGAAAGAGASVAAGARVGVAAGSDVAAHGLRRRRWRRIAIGGIAAVAVIAAGITWFARVGRAGTLIGDKVLAENDLVLVSEFENHTADSSLSSTVTDAVRMDLQESRAVRVMSQAAMWGGLQRMGLEHGTVLPQPKVQELAEREGAKAFVVGNIARVGASFQITARVIATNGGSEALVAHATARDSTGLIGAVQDVGRTLRRGVGESLRSVMTAPALAQVTTASLPALRAYSASRRAELEGQRPRAVVLSKEAIALDSGFASAWSGLAVTYTNMGLVRPAVDAVVRAYALRGHLSELERLRIEAFYHATRGEMVETEAAWQRLAELGRDETNYTDFLLSMGRLREAEDMGRRAVVSESKRSIAYWNLAEAQVGLHHFAGADSTADLIAKNLPENPYRYFIASGIRWGRRDLDAVESYLASPDAAKIPYAGELRCQAHLYRGQVRAWQNCPAPPGGPDRVLTIAAFRLTGDTVRARAGYAPFLAAAPDKRDPDEYPGVIVLLADVGKVREARQLLDEWRVRTGPSDPEFRADSAAAVGAVAAAEKQWDRATAAFLAWNTSPMASARHVYNRGLPEAAAILARRGQADSAIVLFERALATSSLFGGSVYEATWYTQSLSTLGDLYEARGDHAKAADNYRRYMDMMKDADPAFAGQVAAVKEKLARVTQEPGGRSKAP